MSEAALLTPPAPLRAVVPAGLVVKVHAATPDVAIALADHDDVRVPPRGASAVPDVIVVVDDPPALDGLDTLRSLLRRPGCPPVVVVSRSAGRLLTAATEGARGTLLGTEPSRTLHQALRAAAAGHAVVAPALHRELAAREHARGSIIARARCRSPRRSPIPAPTATPIRDQDPAPAPARLRASRVRRRSGRARPSGFCGAQASDRARATSPPQSVEAWKAPSTRSPAQRPPRPSRAPARSTPSARRTTASARSASTAATTSGGSTGWCGRTSRCASA